MKTILAVSGGVDSVAMLNSLATKDGFAKTNNSDTDYIVAHFDHGIRHDSLADARFVAELAKKHKLQFELGHADELDANASEATARKHRWDFLRQVKDKYGADNIATAHHRNDVFETQAINLIRGTGRRGVNVLKNTQEIARPLIEKTKAEIYDYVLDNKLEYVEDSTNQDTHFLRNKLRNVVIQKIALTDKERLNTLFEQIIKPNQEIDDLLNIVWTQVANEKNELISFDRHLFKTLPENIQNELIKRGLEKFPHSKQKISSKVINSLQKFVNRKDSNKDYHISGLLTAHITKTSFEIKVEHKSGKKRELV